MPKTAAGQHYRGSPVATITLWNGERTQIRDTPGDLMERLEALAAETNMSRSAVIRLLLEQGLGTPEKVAAIREAVVYVHSRLKPIIGRVIREMSDQLADELVEQLMDEEPPG